MNPGPPETSTASQQLLEIEVPIVWDYVRHVRHQVETALLHLPEEQRSATVMVASELLENAIKYGSAVPALARTRFTLEYTPQQIVVRVENGLSDRRVFDAISNLLEQMKDEKVCEQLYLSRIQELIDNPFQSNRLGLYRIGYEGKFSLTCTCENDILTMTARRALP